MIKDAINLAESNPLLLAGIGTVVFGSLMYFVRGIPTWLFGLARRLLTIEIFLTSESFLYHEILEVLSKSRVGALARCYATDSSGDLVSGYGTSLSVFARRLILFNRELIEKNFRLDEKLHVTILSRDVGILRAIIAKAREPKVDDAIKVYASSHGSYWHPPVKRKKRALDTVFANGHTKELIINRIAWFLANEQWYMRRGIPYKLAFLLHGEPGTGKSSLIYAVASYFGRGLGALSSISGIDELLRMLPENTFAVIEDIDMISTARRDDEAEESQEGNAAREAGKRGSDADAAVAERQLSALQILINTMDGFATPHGLILFVTTNHKDRLDAALVRSSRIDHEIEVGPLDAEASEAMFVAFYGEESRELFRSWASSPGFRSHTGADLQAVFMTTSPELAIERLSSAQRGNVVAIKPTRGFAPLPDTPENRRADAAAGAAHASGYLASDCH